MERHDALISRHLSDIPLPYVQVQRRIGTWFQMDRHCRTAPQAHRFVPYGDESKQSLNPSQDIVSKPVKCPLCSCELEYQSHQATPIWICPECPFIGFEFVTQSDVVYLTEYLTKRAYKGHDRSDSAQS